MVIIYCIDVYTPYRWKWFEGFPFTKKISPYGDYFSVKVDSKGKKTIVKNLHKHKIRYRIYEEKWARSTDYRREFIKNNKAPYRCRYCNRKLKQKYMVVDHVIPVNKVKNSLFARLLINIQGMDSVNDIKNLVASCKRCNSAKSDKMGLWLIRAYLGRYKIYWLLIGIVKLFIKVLCTVAVIYLLIRLYTLWTM